MALKNGRTGNTTLVVWRTMDLAFLFGTVTGIVTPMLCCLVGLALFAWRGRGRTRLLGIIGTALLLFCQLFELAWMPFGLSLGLATGIPAVQWVVLTLGVVLQAGGLVLIGLAFVTKPSGVPATQSPRADGSVRLGPGPEGVAP
ncbi:hypothetical protein [Brevibacterium zhoupengii]|uniref:hypothetical protein n=2 Tax=Brevibacterium zhoupengii TaxID=2898795 RepID=UPI001F094433|nr:hypothetical protein [Brevibacterium zhoupengii]